MLAKTPSPPYDAVIFSSLLEKQHEGYTQMADKMLELVSKQEGFLGFEAAREELGITVSYWRDLNAIKKWKNNSRTHLNFLFFSEDELVFFHKRQFLKGIAPLLPRKLTKYEEKLAIF